MGHGKGIEPLHNGSTIHRVNPFTISAINKTHLDYIIKSVKCKYNLIFFVFMVDILTLRKAFAVKRQPKLVREHQKKQYPCPTKQG